MSEFKLYVDKDNKKFSYFAHAITSCYSYEYALKTGNYLSCNHCNSKCKYYKNACNTWTNRSIDNLSIYSSVLFDKNLALLNLRDTNLIVRLICEAIVSNNRIFL
jgi:hypothetical protein